MGIKRHTEKSLNVACTDSELTYRKKTFPNLQSIMEVKHKICCTACGINLMKEVNSGLMCIHPSLEVIICKDCLDFYGDGLYKTDKNGDDVYCRWCAQGGTIYCCSKCSVAFCKKCIERNLKSDRKVMADINKDNWGCFICVSKPLWYLRAFCWAVQKYKDELDDTRKRKLSTSSAEYTAVSKPGPASAKKSFAGPASKKPKLETSAIKKPGPASKTIKVDEPEEVNLSDDDKPIQTRHKKIDYSEKIEFPMSPPKKKSARKSVTSTASAKKPASVGKRSKGKKKYFLDVSSDEDFNDFEEEEDDKSTPLESEYSDPMETIVTQVFDLCYKLSNNFNNKLMRYSMFFKGNLDTSDKINNACVNLHMDLKKVARIYNAIDEKMMGQLDAFNVAQQELEKHKLAVDGPVDADIDFTSYGIDPKTPPEPTPVDTSVVEGVDGEFISNETGEVEKDVEMGPGSPELIAKENGDGTQNGLPEITDSVPEYEKNKGISALDQTNGHAVAVE